MHPSTFLARTHQPGTSQRRQVARYRRLWQLQYLNQKTDADLLVTHQIQQPQPRSICQHQKKSLNPHLASLNFHSQILP
jgi:hypothetical protein